MWNKREIKIEDIPSVIEQGKIMAKAGNPLVQQLRCVFTLEEDPIDYMIPLLDFVDIPFDKKFTSFFLCQMVP